MQALYQPVRNTGGAPARILLRRVVITALADNGTAAETKCLIRYDIDRRWFNPKPPVGIEPTTAALQKRCSAN